MSDTACDRCLIGSAALARVGGHLQRTAAPARPRGLLALDPEELIRRVGGGESGLLLRWLAAYDPERERERCGAMRIFTACRHRGAFRLPERLVDDPEAPRALFAVGDPSLIAFAHPTVGVVGARRADSYGREVARRIGRESVAAGAVVVSGLALGVDASAHVGALDARPDRTVAVVGGGVDRPYPRANAALHSRIAAGGCIVSELPPGTGVWRWSFPARNRLIAALSDVLVVVQAGLGSGSLHTAEAALARGVPVAGVPGRIDSELSAGVNRLLADGALVVGAPEVVPALVGLQPVAGAHVPPDLRPAFDSVLGGSVTGRLESGGDEAARLALDLARLELAGLVERVPGGRWVLTARSA